MTIELAYEERAVFDAPIDEVYAYRLDYKTLSAYNPNVTNIRRTDGGSEPGPGAHYVFDLSLPGMGQMEAFLTVVEADRPHSIVTDTGSATMSGREINTFTTLPDGRTQLEISFSMDLPDEAKEGVDFLEGSGRDQYVLELENMKKILES